MGILQISLFGGLRVTHDDWRSEVKLTREIQALLAYLLLQRHRAHSRELLAEVFWRDYDSEKARRALSTALWRLKKALEPEGIAAGTYLISNQLGEVGFNHASHYWLDVEIFEKRTDYLLTYALQGADASIINELERILALYRGDVLEDIYDDWALRERERLRAIYLKSLSYLMQYYEFHEEYEKACVYGQQILDLDPIREDISREMMKLYLKSGQRALAAREYQRCCSTLVEELGVLPMEETQLLYTQIFPETRKEYLTLGPRKPINFEHALEQLQQISQTIDLVKDQVQHTIQSLTNDLRNDEFSKDMPNQKGTSKIKGRRIMPHVD